MSDIEPTTAVEQPVGTEGTPPAATPPTSTTPATEDKTVTLKEEDYKNLVAARDRANNANNDQDEVILTLAEERNERLKVKAIDTFLEQNKDKYPDLKTDDLMIAQSLDDLSLVADRAQRRVEDIVQEKLMNVQKAGAPTLSPEQKSARLETLKKTPGSSAFGEMLDLKRS